MMVAFIQNIQHTLCRSHLFQPIEKSFERRSITNLPNYNRFVILNKRHSMKTIKT